MAVTEYPFMANGNISASRFVKIDSTADFKVIQCSASTDRAIGVSTDATKYPQVDSGFGSGANAYVAEAGDRFRVYCPGEICLLEVVNSGTVPAPAISPGDLLIPDTNGRGIKWTTNASGGTSGGALHGYVSQIGAIALEAPSSGLAVAVIRVMVTNYANVNQ